VCGKKEQFSRRNEPSNATRSSARKPGETLVLSGKLKIRVNKEKWKAVEVICPASIHSKMKLT
jgi:hypothetical protein